jgi:hypothetical protein
MIAALLLMIVAGIGLTQAVCDPNAVTLRWLRLGGILAVTFGAVALAATVIGDMNEQKLPASRSIDAILIVLVVLLPAIVQLLTVQVGERTMQRVAAGASFVILGGVAWGAVAAIAITDAPPANHNTLIDNTAISPENPNSNSPATNSTSPSNPKTSTSKSTSLLRNFSLLISTYLSAGLLGGFLMTMLLGHAYLTAGNEMTQAPFRRLIVMIAVLLLLRTLGSVVFGLIPWLNRPPSNHNLWPTMLVTTRFAVGILVAGIFTYMIHDCVKRRANQSATGILYVAAVLIIIGEMVAISLCTSTPYAF